MAVERGDGRGEVAARARWEEGSRPVAACRRAEAVNGDGLARVRDPQLVLFLLLVTDDLDLAVAREQASLVAAADKVGQHLAE